MPDCHGRKRHLNLHSITIKLLLMKDHYFLAVLGRRYSFLPVWVLGLGLSLSSCMSVKAYQKMYLNDAENGISC